MKKFLMPLLLLLLIQTSQAQTATTEKTSHYRAAEEMLGTMDREKMTNNIMEQMLNTQLKSNPMFEAKRGAMEAFFKKYMNWQSLKEDYIKIYMDEFSEAEIKNITAFYRTATGKKLAEKAGILAIKGSEIGQQRVMSHMPELQEMLRN